MDDFGLLTKDFGLRSQDKSAPMAAAPRSSRSTWSSSAGDPLRYYSDVFGSAAASHPKPSSPKSFDSLFEGFDNTTSSKPTESSSSSNLPVYDKPVYDDDIFNGVPGVRTSHTDVFDEVFASSAPPPPAASPPIDDLLESLSGMGRPTSAIRGDSSRSAFDELIPGFGGSSESQRWESVDTNHKQAHGPSARPSANAADDPFVVLETPSSATSSPGLFTDRSAHINMSSGSKKSNDPSVNDGAFDDISMFSNSVPLSTRLDQDEKRKERSPERNASPSRPSTRKEPSPESSFDPFEHMKPKMQNVDDRFDSSNILFERPSKHSYSSQSFDKSNDQKSDLNMNGERDASSDMSPRSDEASDLWLTVDEIPLVTQPTNAPPPSRPPPPVGWRATSVKTDHGASAMRNDSVKTYGASPIDEHGSFDMGRQKMYGDEDFETNSAAAASAAAMKEAMDRAEAKLRQAKEVRERERDVKSFKSREFTRKEVDERVMQDPEDQEDREMQERLERDRVYRENEEKEREEKKRERERELERERARARQAVERATREARERAAAEARLKAERAAVEKANAEARIRAERAAVQKAAAEARERAAAEAREKAAAEMREKAAMETREKAAAEAREKAAERAAVGRAQQEARVRAERAAVERAAAEARERAAAEARERATAAAREKQYTNENDLESFFGMGTRASSAPRPSATSSETTSDTQSQTKGGSDRVRKTSVGSSTVKKSSSTTNIVDDLSSIFGAAASSGEFQDVEGENEERRKARFERHQRTLERAAKALAEKNERDMQVQREQAERHRMSESLDFEIKRWAAGKEGNLRALLSTLQYVLWPECGWQPVSLTDLITSASVKKVYRRATLCVHPDKVQQKGATLQQKYIAEKVFDLLKEAWNKLNSEELF